MIDHILRAYSGYTYETAVKFYDDDPEQFGRMVAVCMARAQLEKEASEGKTELQPHEEGNMDAEEAMMDSIFSHAKADHAVSKRKLRDRGFIP
jgi:hypothetical protein